MEKNSKLLSVIVPVYKAEKYLHRCVDSILAQTWTNLEIILVDDGSPDRCGEICDEYASKDERVRVIHKTNGGVSSARNAGIDASKGEYIAFVDSDDYIAPEMYERLFSVMSSDKSIAVCDFMMDFGDGHLEPKTTIEVGNSTLDAIKSLLLSDVGGGSVYMISPRCVVGDLRFPEYLRNGEDLWFVLRLFSNAESVGKVSAPMYYYDRSNSGSLTHGWSYAFAKECSRGYCENLAFIMNNESLTNIVQEWAWSVLRYKSIFVMHREYFEEYKNLLPDANQYVMGCPLISSRIKLLMTLLNKDLDIIASILLRLNKLKQCATHT